MQEWRERALDEALDCQPMVHHIDRIALLLEKWLPEMILEHGCIDTIYEANGRRYQYVVTLSNYRCVRQQITPDESHLRNMNYAVDLMVDLMMVVYRLPEAQPKRPSEEVDQKKLDIEGRRVIHTEHLKDHIICSFPNMLHSVGCILSDACGLNTRIQNEVGGSFILRGKRRFIPFMERLHYNEPFFFKLKGVHVCEVRSEHLDRPHRSTSTMQLVLTPCKRGKGVGQGRQISAALPFLKPHVPMHVLVMALGISFEDYERSLYQMDVDPDYLKTLVGPYIHRMRFASRGCDTKEDALMHIAGLYKRYDPNPEKLRRSIVTTLKSEVLPHLNFVYPEGPNQEEQTNRLKVRYLSWLSALLYRFGEGQLPATDRDSYQYLVLDGSAELLAQLFRQMIVAFTKQGIKTMRRALKMKPKKKRKMDTGPDDEAVAHTQLHKKIKLDKVYNANRLTPKMMSAVSTGRWSDEKKGVSHPLRSTNGSLIQSQLRRVSSSFLTNQGKHIDPRMIHPTSYGYMCAAETPDGESCGLVYTLAITCMVTPDGDGNALIFMLLNFDLKDLYVPLESLAIDEAVLPASWWKLIGPHGILWGWVKDGEEAVRRVRRLRRTGAIDRFTSVYLVPNKRCLCIKTSPGRVTRPLLVMENIHKLPHMLERNRAHGRPLLSVLLQHGVIEYLDAAESYSGPESVCVALGPRHVESFHTHMELTDNAFVGICAAAIPMFRHNQGPRLVYQIGMGKQYISPEAADDYGANTSHYLHYGQHPLVTTAQDSETSCDGANVILAFFPHDRSQEDAVVVKREAVDRGLFTTTSVRTHTATHTPRNVNQPQDAFERPNRKRTFAMKMADYDKLQDNGMPKVGTKMDAGDIVMGRTIPHSHVSTAARVKVPNDFRAPDYHEYRRDASVQLRKDEAGTVHEVIMAPGIRKVRIRTVRDLYQGDKLSNRHGQKGTVGKLEEAINMPFNPVTGMIPDIICGPTSMPSRMTMGFPLEMMFGKAVALSAMKELGMETRDWDAAITEETIKKIGLVLKKFGYQSTGREVLCDGITGNQLECDIMVGPVMMGKLDHFVCKKVHARARGPTQPVTRQPIEGRRNDGGFRLGSMEIDVLVAYGVAHILRERTMEMSDAIKMYRCSKCGFAGDANPDVGMYICRYCRTSKYMRTLKQSMSSAVMFTELASNGISTRFELKDI